MVASAAREGKQAPRNRFGGLGKPGAWCIGKAAEIMSSPSKF
jgi:hypothetical protein